jgi:hypothetical protein
MREQVGAQGPNGLVVRPCRPTRVFEKRKDLVKHERSSCDHVLGIAAGHEPAACDGAQGAYRRAKLQRVAMRGRARTNGVRGEGCRSVGGVNHVGVHARSHEVAQRCYVAVPRGALMHSGDGEESRRAVVEATMDLLRRAACERVAGMGRESCSGTSDAVRCGRAVRLGA